MNFEDAMDLSDEARRVLAHLRGRTRQGAFACQLYNMERRDWDYALHELHDAGYRVRWVYGHVADDPTVSGGFVLAGEPEESRQ